MKKLLSIAAIAAFTTFAVSCGNGEEEAKRIADSTASANTADSALKAEQAKRVADSTMMANAADSTAKAVEAKRVADSIAEAGSKKGSKPKTPAEKQKIENKKATGGRG